MAPHARRVSRVQGRPRIALELVTYTQVVEIWHSTWDSKAKVLHFDAIDPAHYTCP